MLVPVTVNALVDAIVRVILNKMFTRKELQRIRDTAIEESCDPELNDTWRSALLRLSDAADHLDAMLARSEVKTVGVAE